LVMEASAVAMVCSRLVRGAVLVIPCGHCSWLVEAFYFGYFFL
jgi:hypothetical protein